MNERIAFIGLGALGAPMAANLIRAGFPLTLHNRSRGRELVVLDAVPTAVSTDGAPADGPPAGCGNARPGVRRAASPAEAVREASIVCLCLSDDAAVEQVLRGSEADAIEPGIAAVAGSGLHPAMSAGCARQGVVEIGASGFRTDRTELEITENQRPLPALPQLKPGALVIDFSTIAPATSRALAAELAARDVAYIDAPVTGGTEGARAGTLSVLVGGAPADLERARPVLEVVGGRISHLGAVGAGQEAKAVNQVLVAGSYAAVAEAVALGQRLGLPMEQVLEALKSGAAGSWALEHRSANMLKGQYPLGFKLALHHKDLAIALAAAAAAGVTLPITEQVAAMEDQLMAAGFGDDDVSALARYYLKD